MILGALVAAGLSPEDLRTDLAALPIDAYSLDIQQVKKQGFAATRVDVRAAAAQAHRHLHHIVRLIEPAALPAEVKRRAIRAFTRLAEVEAAVHGTTIEKVHFHEVGAVDAIVDVVGAMAGLHRLGIDRVICSPIPTGSGTVRCEHGVMPVPAPATAELLRGVPLAECEEPGELTTPTGAAILTTISDGYGTMPAMRIERSGYGAGAREGKTRPNLLRVFVGESQQTLHDGPIESIVLLETNLDDATGQEVGHAMEALFAAGALDVFTTAIQMKKNRPGVLLSVLAAPEQADACEAVLFAETPTLGVRRQLCVRRKLARRIETVETPFGSIRIKIGGDARAPAAVSPEYEDCAAAARAHSVRLRDVMFSARQAWADRSNSGAGSK